MRNKELGRLIVDFSIYTYLEEDVTSLKERGYDFTAVLLALEKSIETRMEHFSEIVSDVASEVTNLMNVLRVTQQIAAIEDREIAQVIESMIRKSFANTFQTTLKHPHLWKTVWEEFWLNLMDHYTVPRLMRSFARKGGKLQTLVVVYVGDAHADNYRKMFKVIPGMELLNDMATSDGWKCLNVSSVNWSELSRMYTTTR